MMRSFVISYDELYLKLINICDRLGIDKVHSNDVCKSVLDAELSGYKSHGLELLLSYLIKVRSKQISSSGVLDILNESENSLYVNSNNLLGPYALSETLRLSFPKAVRVPIFMFTIKDCDSVGSLRYYLKMAEEHRLIPLLFVCSHFPIVAPASSKGRLLGTNPLGASFPSSGNPFLIDTSCSIHSLRETILQVNGKETHKEPWIVDQDGVLTTDPKVIMRQSNSFLLPIGGKDHGYKGSCIGLLTELLGRGLTRTSRSDYKNSVVGILINPSFFEGWDAFCTVSDHIQTRFNRFECRYPGMVSFQTNKDTRDKGIHILFSTWSSLFRIVNQNPPDHSA
jgi:LDH2 family malate/lactate/ureidoglycolate dehydrogenase